RAGPCGRDRARAGAMPRGRCRGDRPADHREFLPLVCESSPQRRCRGMSLTFTILGCSSSTGVPRVVLGWGAGDPNNPKNRRRRCSLLVERHDAAGKRTAVLVDTSPDLREQLLGAEVGWLDGVLFTHSHADHTHGIDDLRLVALANRRRVEVYADAATLE